VRIWGGLNLAETLSSPSNFAVAVAVVVAVQQVVENQ
jgi:hypothetical protein